jgi:hypothetical protein
VVATALLLAFGALAWGSTKVQIVHAAGNPLYLHGTGTAPGCTPAAMDPSVGVRATACGIQSQASGVSSTWSFTNLPAQTVAAGVWTFTMYWTGGTGSTNDTVTVSAGISATASCAGFVAVIPNAPSTWSTTFGSSGANPTSPFTVSTSASQLPLLITPGGSLCLTVLLTHNTGGKPTMVYDGTAGTADTRLIPPTTVVPESLLGFIGLALAIPLFASRRRLLSLVKVGPR